MIKRILLPLLRAVLLGAMAAMLLLRLLDGTITWYINARFVPLTVMAVLFLLVMTVVSLVEVFRRLKDRTTTEKIPVWGLILLAVPLLMGWGVQANPLSAAALDTRGFNLGAPSSLVAGQSSSGLETNPDALSILDWVQVAQTQATVGQTYPQEANVIGFVYHSDEFPAQTFMVSRFVVTCCAADAFPIGMLVSWPGGADLADDTWVQVQGPVSVAELDGYPLPLIEALHAQRVDAPEQPYLFP